MTLLFASGLKVYTEKFIYLLPSIAVEGRGLLIHQIY